MLTTPGPISLADPRIAEEIDRRVAERTAELSAVIEELRRTNSERRRADEDLRAREAFLDSMIDSFPVPIGIMTARGECAAVNQPVLDYTGKTLEELKLWTTTDVVHAEDRAAAVTAWERALESGLPYQIETRLRRADGGYRWHNVHAFPMRDARGRILRWLVIQLDVHDRRDPEVLLNSFIDSIAAPVTLCAPTGEMVAVNRFGQEYHRKSAEEIMDWTSGDMILAADLPRVIAAWQRSIETGEPYDVELRARRAHGPYRWMRSHGFPVRDADGRILRWCVLHLDIHDKKLTEEALAASERNLKLTINTIPAMAWSADTSGNVEFFNDNFLDYVGLPLAEMLNGGWRNAVHPDDVEHLLETWKTVMGAGNAGETEARLRRFDGTYRWFLMRVSPLRDEAGKVVRWYGVNTDIEDWRQTERERRQAEESLRASELMQRSMLDSIAAPLGFFKPNGELEVANRLVGDYFGKTFAEFSDWDNIVHPDDLSASRAAWQHALETGDAYVHEARIRRADGAYRWNDHRGYPMRDAAGRIVRWCVLQTDIHDRKVAEQALAASERKLDDILRTIPAMAWSADANGMTDFYNQHHLDYVGRSLEEMRGTGFISTFHPDDLPRLLGPWQEMMASGRGGEVEGRIRRFDGEYRWFLFRTNPLLDDSGKVVRWYGINIDIEDRKRAEEAVRTSELRLRRQTETIPQMLWSATADGAIDYCNERLLEYSGLTAAEVMDGGWVNLLHPDDREFTAKAWMQCIATGEPYTVEVRQFHVADQTYRWVLTMARPLRDSEGRVIKWYGSCADIHDRKEAERALAKSERRLQEIIDAIPALVWSAHADGSADFVNQYYLDYVGMTTEEVVGWGWTAAVHPDDLPVMIANWKRILDTGRPGDNQARLRRADGEYRWFLFRGNPVADEAGNVKWFGANIDIEERKRADDALRASELSLRRQTETIPQMLWSANPDGSFDYCNARFLDYTGTTAGAVMGDGWKNAIHPDDQEATARAWKHAVATGEPYQVEVRKFCAAAGAYHWCLTTALPLRDEEGRIVKWHGTSVDMHDWKQAQDELRDTQAELAHMTRVMTMGHLTASIAHELNQPLAGIITNASTCMRMLASDPPNVAGARETARRTIRDGNRAAEVIARLRALFSKKDTAIEAVDLNTATQEVIALTLSELQRANVNLRVELAETLPFVKGDRVQLQQVIMNLILNAMQAMDGVAGRAKELVVATQRDGADSVRVVVRDAGVGFDTATAEKLFHPFYTTKSHGMGIGLSVSRSIVENHHGRLWAERNDGPGATFLVSIPSKPDREGVAVNA